MVAGFEVAGLSVEETSTSEISVQVVLLQNLAERAITIGVQTMDGSAKGRLIKNTYMFFYLPILEKSKDYVIDIHVHVHD